MLPFTFTFYLYIISILLASSSSYYVLVTRVISPTFVPLNYFMFSLCAVSVS